MSKHYTVSEVAKLGRISVRTLHHYDEIGLLVPSERSDAGYRLYATRDLERLRQISTYKLLGFPLEEIRRVLDDPQLDLRASLAAQREILVERRADIDSLLTAVDAMLQGENMETSFEALERWGSTHAYREAARRTATYGDAEWAAMKAEAQAIYSALAAELDQNATPDAASVQALVERHRLHIDRWFYACDVRMHRNLAGLYANDARYAKNIDRARAGLTAFLCAAIEITS